MRRCDGLRHLPRLCVAEDWAGKLPPPGAQEREMLSGCIDVRPNSRLTCQIVLSGPLDGIVIEVPESQT
jgi:2Fe-2S ferredoxin